MTDIEKATKHSLIRHIQSHNKELSYKHLEQLPYEALLSNAHPLCRDGYAKLLYKEGAISEGIMRGMARTFNV
jgi:hypothetical protein